MKQLKPGDKIKLKTRTIFGWKGNGTVVNVFGETVQFLKDGQKDDGLSYCCACRHEVSKRRNSDSI